MSQFLKILAEITEAADTQPLRPLQLHISSNSGPMQPACKSRSAVNCIRVKEARNIDKEKLCKKCLSHFIKKN